MSATNFFQELGLAYDSAFLPEGLGLEQQRLKGVVQASVDRFGADVVAFSMHELAGFFFDNLNSEGKEFLDKKMYDCIKATQIKEESLGLAKETLRKYFSILSGREMEEAIAKALNVRVDRLSPKELVTWNALVEVELDKIKRVRFNAFFFKNKGLLESHSMQGDLGDEIIEFSERLSLDKRQEDPLVPGRGRVDDRTYEMRQRLDQKRKVREHVQKAVQKNARFSLDTKSLHFAVFSFWVHVLREEIGKPISEISDAAYLKKYEHLLEEKKKEELALREKAAESIRDEILKEEEAAEDLKVKRKSGKKKTLSASPSPPAADSPGEIEQDSHSHPDRQKKEKCSAQAVHVHPSSDDIFVSLNNHRKTDMRCARRVLRWDVSDEELRRIMSFDPPKYITLNIEILRLVRDCHFMPAIERLCRPEIVKDYGHIYNYSGRDGSPKTGVVFFAVKTTELESVEGLIHVGIDAANVIYHADFQPIGDVPLSVQRIAANLDADVVETIEGLVGIVGANPGEFLSKTGWHVVGSSLFFAGSRPGSIDLMARASLTFSIYKLTK